MKKSILQERAERAAALFRDKARKPLVIEFAGVPKAGKTTTLTQVQAFLKRCGFRTDVMVERASVCPIRDKKHANFNIWTLCTTLAQILEKTQNPPRSDDPQILEEILSFPKELVTKAFGNRNFIGRDRAERFLHGSDQYDFRIRDQVENDKSRVQALPIVVIRNADGDVLRLRRRERSAENPLHDKVVLWAGGHVRREDADNGDPLIRCAVRELEEELRLQIRLSDLVPIGAVYFNNGGSTSKHVAIAYEWRSATNDVSVVLSRSEFFERRGTSLSGSFACIDKLVDDVQTKRLREPWSVELIREHLATKAFDEDMSLFDT